MADDAPAAEPASITFSVKASNDAKYTFTLPDSTSVADLKEKLSSSEYAETPADRQRLIYSGRVLKDNETLSSYKIKDGHTIHLVKSAASNQRQNPPPQSSSSGAGTAPSSIPGVPTNIAAGTGNNPLAGLTGARYAGFAQLPGAGMFGPDGGMGPPPDPDQMLSMLENPQVQATMNEALQNPALIDLMIQQNPMLREMGPGVRQMMQSPEFRRMLTDPAAIRQMAQMQRAFGGMGFGGAGNTAFPAPGVTNATLEENRNQQQQGADQAPGANPPVNPFGAGANPFAGLFGMPPLQPPSTTGQQNITTTESNTTGTQAATDSSAQNQQVQNPFAALFNPAMFGMPPGQNTAGGASQAPNYNNLFNPQNNPFMRDPALLQNVMQAMGGGNAGAGAENPWASLFGAPPAAAQPDNRPPEERYAEQLRQLNDMGFYDFDRNITALRRSGGSVQGAVDFLLNS
ncbi:ubiquitin-like protein DskB, putative [Talaromyces stipitatus ATCC 10500]|uniref:Ubiquitin-like protein DskB, putative n=1 Tax=Talaromyces stipitatus (strain ATCC 10500 / CBS 375.48 / QM 6759 / NRRL 1006) TaxID=441959 RepID=B8LZ67_TALSN|nr:ubiquitin-like protein DskB, putative [Talaromyces stipitatus ATCC 10500]EED21111.1 ubiquitin-like protein DskB, putative [Talaromyces stipitatus ATCC 10500]